MRSSSYEFDTVIDRTGTNTYKWDYRPTNGGGTMLLPMWVADMDFPCPPAVQDALQDRSRHPVFGYTFVSDDYNQAFLSWQATRNNWRIDESSLLFAPAVMPAVRAAILACSDPGDEVVIQPPVYFPFFHAVRDNGRTVVENRLVQNGAAYEMDIDHLRSVISPRTRMLVLCSPHNPVGRVWSRDELTVLADVALEHNLVVVSDEIHSDITRSGVDFVPIASLGPEIAARTISTHSPSKTFNIAGIASAHVVVPDEGLRGELKATLSRLGMTMPNLLSLEASRAAYGEGGDWTDALLDYLDRQLAWFAEQIELRFGGRIGLPVVEGTYLAWLDFRPLMEQVGVDHHAVQHALLEGAALWLSEGGQFGENGVGFFRMNLATPRSLAEEGLDRLAQAVDILERST